MSYVYVKNAFKFFFSFQVIVNAILPSLTGYPVFKRMNLKEIPLVLEKGRCIFRYKITSNEFFGSAFSTHQIALAISLLIFKVG